MNRSDVQTWLDAYVAAWRANHADPIAALFTEDATYRYRPWGGTESGPSGRDAIVANWLEEPDDPAGWEAQYEVYAIDGDRAVAVGVTRYLPAGTDPERIYHNVFLLRFAADGRCAEFTELFMQER